jgi:ligand-binding SRPBCC domain-containing protein
MKHFKHTFVVNSNIDRVWKFYTNINHLKIITPKKMKIEILNAQYDILEEGAEAWLQAKLITDSKWHSKITYLKPYEYVDEMISGRFKTWKHLHKFNKINDTNTEIIDQIDFQLHCGFVGTLFEGYVMRVLSDTFEYRKQATIEALRNDSQI